MKEILETPRQSEYFTLDGLRTLTGLKDEKWDFCILKELIDNALDVLDTSKHKELDVTYKNDEHHYLAVGDPGDGIPEAVLDRVFDFDVYVSDKRNFNIISRGCQGNALKTIIAICHLNNYQLKFFTNKKAISYKINESKLKAGKVEFEKSVQNVEATGAVVVCGDLTITEEEIKRTLWRYYLCNPDVVIRFNGEIINPASNSPLTVPIKRTNKTFIHWYTLNEFSELLHRVHYKDPARTTKSFCLKFSGAQRILSRLEFPYKKLADFINDDEKIEQLYNKLKRLTSKPNPKILLGNLTGKEALYKIYNNSTHFKYKRDCGEYEDDGAIIPYAIEGMLVSNGNENTEIIISVNNSITYRDDPFDFIDDQDSFYFLKHHSEGFILFLNLICPSIKYTDKSKTGIIADGFRNQLAHVYESITDEITKEAKRAFRERRKFDKKIIQREEKKKRNPDIKTLLKNHFWEAYLKASGNELYPTHARQVYYPLREIINTRYNFSLPDSAYNTLTQETLTEFYEEKPDLEKKIFLDRRGTFLDPLTFAETPLGTKDVHEFIEEKREVPIELLYNHVLFIEKEGFNIILKESGLVEELNLGIITPKGFGNRATKKMISHFLKQGITVYALHDCDISGYSINYNLENGSKTFPEGLGVKEIGLTVDDIKRLGKESQAEIAVGKKQYDKTLNRLTPDEREFFDIDNGEPYHKKGRKNNEKAQYRYRRIEINALSTPELLDFIRSKIPFKPIKPSVKQIEGYIKIDKEEIINTAFTEALIEHFKDFNLSPFDFDCDRAELAKAIRNRIKKVHWLKEMKYVQEEYALEKKNNIREEIKKALKIQVEGSNG